MSTTPTLARFLFRHRRRQRRHRQWPHRCRARFRHPPTSQSQSVVAVGSRRLLPPSWTRRFGCWWSHGYGDDAVVIDWRSLLALSFRLDDVYEDDDANKYRTLWCPGAAVTVKIAETWAIESWLMCGQRVQQHYCCCLCLFWLRLCRTWSRKQCQPSR